MVGMIARVRARARLQFDLDATGTAPGCRDDSVIVDSLGSGLAALGPLRRRFHRTGPFSAGSRRSFSVQFVVEQGGRIRVVRNGVVQAQDFIDLRSQVLFNGERGLLGLAFAPDGSGRCFVNFVNRSGDTVVARFRRSSNPLVATASSRFDLRCGRRRRRVDRAAVCQSQRRPSRVRARRLSLHRPRRRRLGQRPGHRAQNPSKLLGKMLRIDVNVPDSHPTGYRVPADNPFVERRPIACAAEIWELRSSQPLALQLRRSGPWRDWRAGDRRRRAGSRSKRSTTNPPGAAAATTGGASGKVRTTTSRRAHPRICP